jgi:hypothetical protein
MVVVLKSTEYSMYQVVDAAGSIIDLPETTSFYERMSLLEARCHEPDAN